MARSKRGGRPREGDGAGGTWQLRVYEDLYGMIYWLTEAEGISSASLIQPLLGPQIQARYDKKKKLIEDLIASRGGDPHPWRKAKRKPK